MRTVAPARAFGVAAGRGPIAVRERGETTSLRAAAAGERQRRGERFQAPCRGRAVTPSRRKPVTKSD
jgi:hypothetical protein